MRVLCFYDTVIMGKNVDVTMIMNTDSCI